ncbi:hypothetical protein ACFXTO_027070 [Malus domestica]
MDDCKPFGTPAKLSLKLCKDKGENEVDSTFYKQIISSLMYLTFTRHDIMYTVSLVSRYMEKPTEMHLNAAKRILRYVNGTIDYGVFYKREDASGYVGYINSHYTCDIDYRKSTFRHTFLLNSDGKIELEYCKSREQVADILTKPLKQPAFEKLRSMLGLFVDANSFPTHHSTQSSLAHSSTATNSNLDRILFKNLVEIIPLVQSFIDRKASNSFMRRGLVAYTKTPSRESVSKKVEQKGRNAAQSIPARQKRDHRDNDGGRRAEEDRSLLSRDAEVKPRRMNYGKFLHEVEKDAVGAKECYCRAVLGSPGNGELLSLYAKLIWETHNV